MCRDYANSPQWVRVSYFVSIAPLAYGDNLTLDNGRGPRWHGCTATNAKCSLSMAWPVMRADARIASHGLILRQATGSSSASVSIAAARWITTIRAARQRKGSDMARKARQQYKTISTHTLAGLKEAERLKAAGWKIISSGLFSIVFYRYA